MLRTVIFLQLTLWVASIRAFYPFFPEWHQQCEAHNSCEGKAESGKPTARDVQTYKLSQRVRDVRLLNLWGRLCFC